jgi:hypothetical protein
MTAQNIAQAASFCFKISFQARISAGVTASQHPSTCAGGGDNAAFRKLMGAMGSLVRSSAHKRCWRRNISLMAARQAVTSTAIAWGSKRRRQTGRWWSGGIGAWRHLPTPLRHASASRRRRNSGSISICEIRRAESDGRKAKAVGTCASQAKNAFSLYACAGAPARWRRYRNATARDAAHALPLLTRHRHEIFGALGRRGAKIARALCASGINSRYIASSIWHEMTLW